MTISRSIGREKKLRRDGTEKKENKRRNGLRRK